MNVPNTRERESFRQDLCTTLVCNVFTQLVETFSVNGDLMDLLADGARARVQALIATTLRPTASRPSGHARTGITPSAMDTAEADAAASSGDDTMEGVHEAVAVRRAAHRPQSTRPPMTLAELARGSSSGRKRKAHSHDEDAEQSSQSQHAHDTRPTSRRRDTDDQESMDVVGAASASVEDDALAEPVPRPRPQPSCSLCRGPGHRSTNCSVFHSVGTKAEARTFRQMLRTVRPYDDLAAFRPGGAVSEETTRSAISDDVRHVIVKAAFASDTANATSDDALIVMDYRGRNGDAFAEQNNTVKRAHVVLDWLAARTTRTLWIAPNAPVPVRLQYSAAGLAQP